MNRQIGEYKMKVKIIVFIKRGAQITTQFLVSCTIFFLLELISLAENQNLLCRIRCWPQICNIILED